MDIIPGFAAAQRAYDRQSPEYGDAEAQEREIEAFKASEAAALVANIQNNARAADSVADEMLQKFGTDEMVAVLRAAFRNDAEEVIKLIIGHAGRAINELAEIEAYKAFN